LLVDSDNEVQASEAREEMRKAIVLVEQSLDALKNGGIAPGIEGNIILPPAPAIIVPKITEIEEYFKTDKELATLLLNEPRFVVLPAATGDSSATAAAEVINWKFKQSIDNLRRRIIDGALLKMNIELTQMFVHQTAASKGIFTMVLFILLAIDALVIAFAFFLLKKTLRPLEPLTRHISGLSNGHIPPPVKISQMDEIGQMAIGLNTLSENLGSA
jgi:methyl-accepting chemotaxis protein